MLRQVPQILLALAIILFCGRCAQIGSLDGGKRDITAPKLVEAVPANKSTNFNSEEIILKFDEYVQLKDISNQLLVSPKLKTAPEITASGRLITITLKKEELAPNTTYRFYFGSAIADMNESNTIANFEYVFSTGSAIDSLKLKGNVTDAFSLRPVAKVLVGLYHAPMADSTPYKEAPDYISKTDEKGDFEFGNLPHQAFNVVAFLDNNKNNFYDGETEKAAFRDSVLTLDADTAVSLRIFQQESQKGFIKKTSLPYYGFGQFILNKKAKVSMRPLNAGLADHFSETRPGAEKDTLSFFYKDLKDTVLVEVDNQTFGKKDTVRLIIPKNNSAKRRLKRVNTNVQGGSLALNSTIRLSFLNWMDTSAVDLSKISLKDKSDTTEQTIPVTGRWAGIAGFELSGKLIEGNNYALKIDTAAFYDLGHYPNDSVNLSFKTQSRTEFGSVILNLLFNKKQNYIVQLTNGEQVVQQQFVSFALSSSNAVSLVFTDIPPANYNAKIIFDDNDNKKWDSGNLLSKKQPERVVISSKQLKVLSDWEIEEEIAIKE